MTPLSPNPTPAGGEDELEQVIIDAIINSDVQDSDYERGYRLDYEVAARKIMQLIAHSNQQARLQAARDIFNLAHEYAQADKTMHGAEELRAYHYFNAIHKIGEFDGRTNAAKGEVDR